MLIRTYLQSKKICLSITLKMIISCLYSVIIYVIPSFSKFSKTLQKYEKLKRQVIYRSNINIGILRYRSNTSISRFKYFGDFCEAYVCNKYFASFIYIFKHCQYNSVITVTKSIAVDEYFSKFRFRYQ